MEKSSRVCVCRRVAGWVCMCACRGGDDIKYMIFRGSYFR